METKSASATALVAHSPGPWDKHGMGVYSSGHDSQPVAWVPLADERSYKPREQKANAALIAAAPELLAALRVLERAHSVLLSDRGCIEGVPMDEEAVIHAGETARAAIAKAIAA